MDFKPYYQDDSCTIYHGDCRQILPHLPKVDLVLTDPPYGMSWQSGARLIKPHIPIFGDEKLPIDLIKLSIEKAMNAAYIFCRWNNFLEMPPPPAFVFG